MATPRLEIVPLGNLHESPHNIRRHFDPAGLQDLIASVTARGIITPLLARPNRKGFELAAGHRRFRAATEAGLTSVPVFIRDMDDHEFMEVLITENLQRQDIHPMDEALGYQALQKADRAYTPEAIAAKVGKSTSYVYQRLKLLALIPKAQAHFEADRITAAHAVRLARLTPADQEDALEECFFRLFSEGDDDSEPAPVSKLDRWIERHTKVEIAAADTPHYFPEVAEQMEQLEDHPETLLQLSDAHMVNQDLGTKTHGCIGRGRWEPIKTQKDRCANVQKGVVVHGGPMRILEVCATKGCPKHRPAAKASPRTAAADPKATEKRQAKEAAEKRTRELEEARRETVEARAIEEALADVKSLDDDVRRLVLASLLGNEMDHEGFNRRFKTKVGYGADVKSLASLSGPTLSQAIVFAIISNEFQNAYRDFKSVDALLKIFGVNRAQIDKEVAAEQLAQEAAAGGDGAPAKKTTRKKKR